LANLSIKTIGCFKKYISEHTTGKEIRNIFERADIAVPYSVSHNRNLSKLKMLDAFCDYLNTDNESDLTKLLEVFGIVLGDIEKFLAKYESDFLGVNCTYTKNKEELNYLIALLNNDGFDYKNGKIYCSANYTLNQLKDTVEEFDFEYINKHIKRMEESIETDTDVTIGEAKSLVETCCKTILKEKSVTIDKKWNIGQLAKAALKELKLTPDDIKDNEKVTISARKILGSLSAIVQGMAELRNIYGSGHGKHGKFKGLPPRYAKLASGAASTFVTFLFETYSEKK